MPEDLLRSVAPANNKKLETYYGTQWLTRMVNYFSTQAWKVLSRARVCLCHRRTTRPRSAMSLEPLAPEKSTSLLDPEHPQQRDSVCLPTVSNKKWYEFCFSPFPELLPLKRLSFASMFLNQTDRSLGDPHKSHKAHGTYVPRSKHTSKIGCYG